MRKFLNIAIALMLLFAPLVQTNPTEDISLDLVYFGSEVDEDCDDEAREDGDPYFVDGVQGNDSNLDAENCPFAIGMAAESVVDEDTVIIGLAFIENQLLLMELIM